MDGCLLRGFSEVLYGFTLWLLVGDWNGYASKARGESKVQAGLAASKEGSFENIQERALGYLSILTLSGRFLFYIPRGCLEVVMVRCLFF